MEQKTTGGTKRHSRGAALLGLLLGLGLLYGCGGSGGGGGGGGGATPSAGWIVANRSINNTSELDVYRADVAGGAPVQTIPNALALASVNGIGVLYQTLPNGDEVGLIAPGAQRIVFANQSGNTYSFLSAGTVSDGTANFLVNNRFIVVDGTGSILSFATNGSDMRVLKSGCGVVQSRLFAKGLLFFCDGKPYASDGLAAAVALPGQAPNPNPAVVDTHPLATDGISAIFSTGGGRLITQPANGTGALALLASMVDPSGSDFFLGSVGSIALGWTLVNGSYDTWTASFDGSVAHPVHVSAAGRTFLYDVTPGQSHFLITIQPTIGQHVALLWPVNGGPSILLSPGGANPLDAHMYDDGNVVLQNMGSAWQVMQVNLSAGTATVGATIGTSVADTFCANVGSYTLLKDAGAGPQPLHSYRNDGAATFRLSSKVDCDANNPAKSLPPHPPGRVLFIDANQLPWVAAPDNSIKAQLDTAASNQLSWTGSGSGNRDFYAINHVSGDFDTIAFHTDSQTIDRIVQGASGPGYFIP